MSDLHISDAARKAADMEVQLFLTHPADWQAEHGGHIQRAINSALSERDTELARLISQLDAAKKDRDKHDEVRCHYAALMMTARDQLDAAHAKLDAIERAAVDRR